MKCFVPCCLLSRATTCKGMLNVAKVQYKLHVASGLNLPWYEIWKKILVWKEKWNGRFLVWNRYGMEQNCQYGIWKNRLPFHSLQCPASNANNLLQCAILSDLNFHAIANKRIIFSNISKIA